MSQVLVAVSVHDGVEDGAGHSDQVTADEDGDHGLAVHALRIIKVYLFHPQLELLVPCFKEKVIPNNDISNISRSDKTRFVDLENEGFSISSDMKKEFSPWLLSPSSQGRQSAIDAHKIV